MPKLKHLNKPITIRICLFRLYTTAELVIIIVISLFDFRHHMRDQKVSRHFDIMKKKIKRRE